MGIASRQTFMSFINFFEKRVLYKRRRICVLISPHRVILAWPDAGRKSKGNGNGPMSHWVLADRREWPSWPIYDHFFGLGRCSYCIDFDSLRSKQASQGCCPGCRCTKSGLRCEELFSQSLVPMSP